METELDHSSAPYLPPPGLHRLNRTEYTNAIRDVLDELPNTVMVAAPNMTPFVTPNADFYRIDTALVAPQVRTEDYTLRIHGMVDNEIRLSYDDLVQRDLIERDIFNQEPA